MDSSREEIDPIVGQNADVRPHRSYQQLIAVFQQRGGSKGAEPGIDVLPLRTESREVCLPPWPNSARGVPNIALRSALFGAISKRARPSLQRQEIHAQDGISIRYTGVRLDQGDLDVWEAILHLFRTRNAATGCKATAYQLLKALGKTDTGKNREILDRRLSRLKATALDVKVVGRVSYEGSLIGDVYRADESRAYVIMLNPKLCLLFKSDQFTHIQWTVRYALRGKPLAQWLHGYYSSHAKPFPVKVETLCRLCGSEAVLLSDFKKDLRRGLDAVSAASRANGEHFCYEIRGDLVHVQRGTLRRRLTEKIKSR
ncbi:plasmid replication initiator TrfA [Pandoraea pnomenusa]|uniref:plasmid replication initiator TrfA n=1 Tax=Pandoraea pnomenusa TaxID=93220 RepID=UPI000AEBBC80|nr:hypothetical protein [Pandoraea pnomenusa]